MSSVIKKWNDNVSPKTMPLARNKSCIMGTLQGYLAYGGRLHYCIKSSTVHFHRYK